MRSWKFTIASLALAHIILLGAITLTAATPYKKDPQSQVKPNPSAPTGSIATGKRVYSSLDCSDCHVLNQKGTSVGPDLTHIGATWTTGKLVTMIRHPRTLKPKGFMTAYGKTKISAPQMKTLVAYLASLK